jgi:glyoxylase-like metal-dependent hydrolase (beta-lactamase superfamily II)
MQSFVSIFYYIAPQDVNRDLPEYIGLLTNRAKVCTIDTVDGPGNRGPGKKLLNAPRSADNRGRYLQKKGTGASPLFEEIEKNIYRIKVSLPRNPLKTLNSYVVVGAERNLLIDLGFNRDECYADLSAGLRALDLDMGRTDIFLTHLHSDHCGLIHRVAREDTRIYMGRDDIKINGRFLRDKLATWEKIELSYVKAGYAPDEQVKTRDENPAFSAAPSAYFETETIDDGALIDLGGIVLKAVHTPGHTPGHMCLFDAERGVLFSGDHILFDITPNITEWEDLDDSLGAYMESLQRVRCMPVRRTLTGHRENEGDFVTRIDEILAHHETRLREVRTILTREPGLTAYELAARMTWSINARCWEEFPPGQKWFAVGEALSHLRHLERGGVIRREETDGRYRNFVI